MSQILEFIFSTSTGIIQLIVLFFLLFLVIYKIPIWAFFVLLFVYVLYTNPISKNEESKCTMKTTQAVCNEYMSGNTSCSNLSDIFDKDPEWEQFKSSTCSGYQSDTNRLLNGYSNDYFLECPDEISKIREKINTFSKNDCEDVKNTFTKEVDFSFFSPYYLIISGIFGIGTSIYLLLNRRGVK